MEINIEKQSILPSGHFGVEALLLLMFKYSVMNNFILLSLF